MKKYLKRLGYLVILLAPLDAFKFLGGYFSVYRLVLILLFVLIIADIISQRSFKYNKNILKWLLAFEMINIIAYILSTQKSLGVSFFLNDTLGVVLIFIFAYVYESNDVDTALLFYVRSQYITMLFSAYCIFIHFISGRSMPKSFSFLGFSYQMTENQLALLARTKSFLPQLFLPYGTTLYLDYCVGIAAIICLYFMNKYEQKKAWFASLALIFSMLTLLSAQKGPIIAYIIALVFYIVYFNKTKGMAKGLFYMLIVSAIVMVVGVSFAREIFLYTIERFTEFGSRTSSGEDRHILLVYEALRIWLDGIKSFFIGVGYSSESMKTGYYTVIPETFLCTYATLLAERGVLGFVSILFYARFWKYVKKTNEMLKNIFIFVMLSFLFYELRYVQTSWIIFAIFSFFTINKYDEKIKKED